MHLSDSIHSFLFLGDSYTIGEGLPLEDSYPYQTIQLLRQAGHGFYAPEIIARTGWTTDELTAAIRRTTLLPAYAYAALLIGVNNQYRGRSAVEYGTQFEQLLLQTLALTGDARRVFVLSIPDWGVSPFAAAAAPSPGSGRDARQIAREIDGFNTAALGITRRYGPVFIDITGHSRTLGAGPGGFAADGLHPAAATYRHWAAELAQRILE